jgi:hypothetical protein
MNVDVDGFGTLALPDFFVLGAAKAGTTSLHAYLAQHPRVVMPVLKEPLFFSSNFAQVGEDIEINTIKGMYTCIRKYSSLYRDVKTGKLLGDASPSYLYTTRATIANIKKTYAADERWKQLRFIVMLRHPVERAWAHYQTARAYLHEPLPFELAVAEETWAERRRRHWDVFFDYLGFSAYTSQLEAYVNAFGRERLKVVLFDDLRRNAAALCGELFSFVGIDAGFSVPNLRPHNAGLGEPKYPWVKKLLCSDNLLRRSAARLIPFHLRSPLRRGIAARVSQRARLDPGTRQRLCERFADEIDKLEHFLGRDLSGWRV